MITNFKIFESNKVGDWVIMTHWWAGQHIHHFIDTTPAQIVDFKIFDPIKSVYEYTVKFDEPFLTDADLLHPGKTFRDVFEEGKTFDVGGMHSWNDWVEFSSPNKKDVLAYIEANKYNL